MAVYPSSIITFTTKTDKVDLVSAAHINTIQDEVTAIQTELGKDVAGSATNLVTRLSKTLADSGVLANGTSFPTSPADGQIFYRTDQDTTYIYDGSVWEAGSNTSNVIYSWGGYDSNLFSTSNPVTAGLTQIYLYCAHLNAADTNFYTVLSSKWKRISGVSTITWYAYVSMSVNGSTKAGCQVSVGGLTSNAKQTNANEETPEWITNTIDVSSLVVGTVYDVSIQLANQDAAPGGTEHPNLFSVILFGS